MQINDGIHLYLSIVPIVYRGIINELNVKIIANNILMVNRKMHYIYTSPVK